MGRGDGADTEQIQASVRKEQIQSGRWENAQGRSLQVIGATEKYSHIAIVARDHLSAILISPKKLVDEYKLVEGDGKTIDISPPPPMGEVPRPLMRGGDWDDIIARQGGAKEEKESKPMTDKQLTYLASLCERTGQPFNDKLDRVAASKEIDRLNRILNG